MRTFATGRLARTTAHLLTVVFLSSVILTSVAGVPAAAQVATSATPTQTVAVVGFEDLSGYPPGTLGEDAAAALAVELRDRLLLDVLPKVDVDLQMADLGLAVPLSDVELVRLAAELDLELMVTGQVRGARIVQSREGRYAEVVLAVRLFDRIARADVNGGLVKARGPASADASDDTLINKALQQAAFEAVEQMRSRPTVTAMVLWARGDTLFLNVGTRGGLRDGMKLVAIRGGERIAQVEVTDADAIGSYARITQGPPLRTGDHLRAIFDLPTALAARPPGRVERSKKRLESVLLAAAILLGLGGHATAARLIGEGNIAFPGFMAANLANGASHGYSGWISSFWIDGRDLVPCPASYLTWGSYQGTESDRLVGIEIWRGGELVNVWLMDEHPDVELIDDYWPPGFATVSFTFDELTGALTESASDFEMWDPDWELDEDTGQWAPNNSWADFVDGYDALISQEGNSWEYGWFPTGVDDYAGPFAGVTYQYRLVPILLRQIHQGPADYTWDLTHGEATTFPNMVVATVPAYVSSYWYAYHGMAGVYEDWELFENPDRLGNLATFWFYEPIGAFDVIIQVTRYPNISFDPGNVYVKSVVGNDEPDQPPPPPYNGGAFFERPPQMSVQVDLTQVPTFSGSDANFYLWRIGGRSGFDTWPPRTYPQDIVNDRGYVWSTISGFSTYSLARESVAREQRDLLSRARAAGARVPRRAAADRVLRAE